MILQRVESKQNTEYKAGNLIQFQPVINFLKNKKLRDQNTENNKKDEKFSIFNTPRNLSPLNTLNTEDSPNSTRNSEFTMNNKNLNFPNFPNFPTNTAFNIENLNPVKPVTCSCKNSQCLKLYCECFSAGAYCDPAVCSCKGCSNTLQSEVMKKNLKIKFKFFKKFKFF
jgi:hypothetical protein